MGIGLPIYRVYFHTDNGSSDEREVTGGDVDAVMGWAEANAVGRTFVLYACVPHDGLGLVRLLGTDPTRPEHTPPVLTPAPRHARASQIGMQCSTLDCRSTQIAVRLPDEMVAFLDRTVATGQAPSRAALVASAVEREMRRLAAEQDAEILRAQGAADDLDALVEWTSTRTMVED